MEYELADKQSCQGKKDTGADNKKRPPQKYRKKFPKINFNDVVPISHRLLPLLVSALAL
jgi:hypothetical protein